MLFDAARLAVFGLFGAGLGFAALTNFIAFTFVVQRPPQTLGVLWWMSAAVSMSFSAVGLVALDRVVDEAGDPPGWRMAATLVGMLVFAVAQVVLFSVERQRLIVVKAQKVALAASPPGTYAEQARRRRRLLRRFEKEGL